MWFEHRTVYVGMPEERQAAIPYYLPEAKDCTPTGTWVVEVKPLALGTYRVPIQCSTNTVYVVVTCIDSPPSDIGYGFYTGGYPDPTRVPPRYGRARHEHVYALRARVAGGVRSRQSRPCGPGALTRPSTRDLLTCTSRCYAFPSARTSCSGRKSWQNTSVT